MIVKAFKTRKVTSGSCKLEELLDEALVDVPEGSVVAITSKIVSLCEGRVVSKDGADKDELVAQHAQLYLPSRSNPYNVALSVARNTLVAAAGIDESNSDGQYVLWPSDPQKSANQARDYLRRKFGRRQLGVVITDSATRPFQWGTTGIAIAYSGFAPIRSYIGQKDLFGREFEYHTNSIVNGLAAAAAVVMGEGSERTPVALLADLDFVEFVDHDPTDQELGRLRIELEADLYAPLLRGAPWLKGQG